MPSDLLWGDIGLRMAGGRAVHLVRKQIRFNQPCIVHFSSQMALCGKSLILQGLGKPSLHMPDS
jgi:hypothetical protein